MTLSIISTTSPTLDGSGQFTTLFGEYEKVVGAIATIDVEYGGVGDGLIFQTSISISGTTVTTTILKADLEQATDANRDWEVALTANVSGKTVSIVADCI